MENTKNTLPPVSCRWMVMYDLPDVLQIEKESFDHPWSQEEFLTALRGRNCVGMVALCDSKIVGFMIYQRNNTKIHLINMAVALAYRRRGIGRFLVEKLKNKLAPPNKTSVSLEVRETNLTAQIFFRSCHFQATAVLRDFYEQTHEDAYQMQHSAPSTTAPVPITPKRYST